MGKLKSPWVMGLLFLGALYGCSSTQLVQRWHDPEFSGPKLNTILVLGVFKDEVQRRAFEQTFADQFDAAGREAVPGYRLVPAAAQIESKAAVAAAVQKAGADAVLITHFKGVSQEEQRVPPRVDYQPAMGFGYYRYYAPVYHRVYRPGYTIVNSIVKLETQVYRVVDEKLVWMGNSESVNSASADMIVKELVSLVVEDMKKRGLID
ncbi:MAG: hypothetical protein WBG37_10535 [Desulfobacterales bacterium]